MNGYELSTPRAALGLTAVAMAAITMGALVVLPAKLDSISADPYTLASKRDATLSVVTEEAKRRALKALYESALSASGIGFVAFPEGGFRTPQAAASASGRLRRELQGAGLITFDPANGAYSLSGAGRQWVAQHLL